RHTRFSRDWSSDVCSSDLSALCLRSSGFPLTSRPSWSWKDLRNQILDGRDLSCWSKGAVHVFRTIMNSAALGPSSRSAPPERERSEERRVGKESGAGGGPQ